MSHQVLPRLSDHELLDSTAARHPAALSELYDRFSKLLYGVILAVVRDTDDAEDILQEVFSQIWRSASTYNPALGSPKTWLVRMAHNRAIDHLRSKRTQQKKSEAWSLNDDAREGEIPKSVAEESTWQETLGRERSVHLSTALARLPEGQRTLIAMAFFEGYTHQEIAEMTGIALGTVKTRIRTGMLSLRSLLHYMEPELG